MSGLWEEYLEKTHTGTGEHARQEHLKSEPSECERTLLLHGADLHTEGGTFKESLSLNNHPLCKLIKIL